ncbi:MAG: DedA family protein [Candidatus Fermentibacteraceae bacterium]|nr:DedA family protein [Candidatus Fermentibacteraceae bacterium]
MIEQILEYLSNNPPGIWAGPLLGIIAFAETLFPPLPGDILFIILAGWAMAGGLSFILAALFGVAGCFLASCILFFIGHSPGRKFVDGWLSRKVNPIRVEKAKLLIKKHGPLVLAGSRFIPGVRSLLVLIAGTSGMRFALAALPVAISAIAWYIILSVAGSILGNNLEAVEGFMKQFEVWIWILLAVIVVVLMLMKRLDKRRQQE